MITKQISWKPSFDEATQNLKTQWSISTTESRSDSPPKTKAKIMLTDSLSSLNLDWLKEAISQKLEAPSGEEEATVEKRSCRTLAAKRAPCLKSKQEGYMFESPTEQRERTTAIRTKGYRWRETQRAWCRREEVAAPGRCDRPRRGGR